MTRRIQLLLGITTTVGVTLVLAWVVVQALVVRPAIGDREQERIRQVLEAAELIRSGVSSKQVEAQRGVDLRLFEGAPDKAPPGGGWVRHPTGGGTVWKREGGRYEIAAWTGRTWVVLQDHLPVVSTLAIALAAGGLPVIILMFGLSQRATRHQEEAERRLAQMAAGDLSERLDERSGNKEARRLAVAVNKMAAQLQVLFESDRKRMAGLSHELRTPLTRVRLELELARREGGPAKRLHQVEREIESFDAMLTEMLDLSRLELVGERLMTRTLVDLGQLAHDVVSEEGLTDVEVRGAGTAMVDRALVARAVKNLLRNSVRHAASAQRWIAVAEDSVSVGDNGPGIAVDKQAHIVQPFRQGDASSGHGLGLAIVEQIAALHGGVLTLSPLPGWW